MMSMSMDSMSISSSHTTVMDMASSTSMSMPSSSSSMDMNMDMDMGMGMHMYFTTAYKNYPVLFKGFHASNAGQAFGIFVLLFFVAFLTRGLEFFKLYLERVVWADDEDAEIEKNMNNLDSSQSEDGLYGDIEERSSSIKIVNAADGSKSNSAHLSISTRLTRDAIRLILCFLPEFLGFAMMLAAMTYTLVYFFAIVTGLGVGRFFFEKVSERYNFSPFSNIRPLHC